MSLLFLLREVSDFQAKTITFQKCVCAGVCYQSSVLIGRWRLLLSGGCQYIQFIIDYLSVWPLRRMLTHVVTDARTEVCSSLLLGKPTMIFVCFCTWLGMCWVRVASSTWNVLRFWNTNKGRFQLLQQQVKKAA